MHDAHAACFNKSFGCSPLLTQCSTQMLMAQKQKGGAGGKGDKYSRLESAIVEDNEEFIRGQQQRQEVSNALYTTHKE
jgi:hypothetical protein